MNYKRIYEQLVAKGKTRPKIGYMEQHHIIPRCIGGSDDAENLVYLTPEEHYIAHQLLVKIYPDNHKLIKAAIMMIPNRPSNKLYGWLRRKLSSTMSVSQGGSGNSQFGTRWIHNLTEQRSMKISKNELLPEGWREGRKINWNKSQCKQCGQEYDRLTLSVFCSDECKNNSVNQRNPFLGKEAEFLEKYKQYGSMNKALKKMGYPGAVSHYYKWAKKVLKDNASVSPLPSKQEKG